MDNLREIEDIQELLQTIPILSIVEDNIQKRALVETVHYTTRIEGNRLDIRTVEKLATKQITRPIIDRDKQEVLNLYKAMDFIRYLAPKKDTPIGEEVIKQIHAFVVRDIPKSGSPGEYRLKQNAIEDETTGERIFLPPQPNDVPRLMTEFCAWLKRTPLAFHPVITAGIAHLELVAIHPFDDGNGRAARALADLILDRHGYGFRRLFSWVAQAGIDMGTYHKTLAQVLGPEYGANFDPTAWLEYFAEAVTKSLVRKRSELMRLREAFVNAYNLGAGAGFTRDQVEAIIYAMLFGYVTTGIYMKSTRLSRSTVVKRLNQLADEGILQTDGKGRNVRYVPSSLVERITDDNEAEGMQLSLEAMDWS